MIKKILQNPSVVIILLLLSLTACSASSCSSWEEYSKSDTKRLAAGASGQGDADSLNLRVSLESNYTSYNNINNELNFTWQGDPDSDSYYKSSANKVALNLQTSEVQEFHSTTAFTRPPLKDSIEITQMSDGENVFSEKISGKVISTQWSPQGTALAMSVQKSQGVVSYLIDPVSGQKREFNFYPTFHWLNDDEIVFEKKTVTSSYYTDKLEFLVYSVRSSSIQELTLESEWIVARSSAENSSSIIKLFQISSGQRNLVAQYQDPVGFSTTGHKFASNSKTIILSGYSAESIEVDLEGLTIKKTTRPSETSSSAETKEEVSTSPHYELKISQHSASVWNTTVRLQVLQNINEEITLEDNDKCEEKQGTRKQIKVAYQIILESPEGDSVQESGITMKWNEWNCTSYGG